MSLRPGLPSEFAWPTRLVVLLCLTITSSLAVGLMASRPSHAEDDYLRGIRAEGHKLEKLDHKSSAEDEVAKPIRDFEAALLLDSPESFRLYQQLPTEKRAVVFQVYQQTLNLVPVRRRIVELRLGN